jgi:hypothetical protein
MHTVGRVAVVLLVVVFIAQSCAFTRVRSLRALIAPDVGALGYGAYFQNGVATLLSGSFSLLLLLSLPPSSL